MNDSCLPMKVAHFLGKLKYFQPHEVFASIVFVYLAVTG
ncbi:hypothetical protein HSIEG1_2165 [Enterococcus sp. HSIEG1]|nr:hypothetical protein HSIEG1_2165 [Enterococcus sp. HSIEG1]